MKKFKAEGGQPTADPSVNKTSADSPSDSPANQDNSIQLPSPYLPPEILEQIINFVPADHRLVIPAVSGTWRNVFTGLPSCWRGIRLGRNANCYPTTPPAIHKADYFPLTHVEEVKFTSAVPAVMYLRQSESRPFADRPTEIPYSWLGLVLKHGGNLKSLDLSLMSVGEGNEAIFRYLTRSSFRI